MRGYSTKNATTTGIREVELTADSLAPKQTVPQRRTSRYERRERVCTYDPRLRKFVRATDDARQLIPGKTFFHTREEAEVNALAQIRARIKLLQRQLHAAELKLVGPPAVLWEGRQK